MKLITPGVFNLIKTAARHVQGRQPVGDVGLAPFHDNDSKVPDDVKKRLEDIDPA